MESVIENVEEKNVKDKNFISYFQSVTTVGIFSQGLDAEEAEEKAISRLQNEGSSCGILDVTPLELSETEHWPSHEMVDFPKVFQKVKEKHDDEQKEAKRTVSIRDLMSEDDLKKLSLKVGKGRSEVTEDDCLRYAIVGLQLLLDN